MLTCRDQQAAAYKGSRKINCPATHPIHFVADSPDKIIAALRKRGPTPNPAKIVYGKLEVVCYKISATNSSIKRFTCSGLSVLELCPAPSIHVKGIFVLRCHALLYRIHEPA